jgi:dephospho-CoA kinase
LDVERFQPNSIAFIRRFVTFRPTGMKLLGITGGIGMGKSMTAQLLSQRGVPVIDTDILARDLVEPGQPALAEIIEALGRDLLDEHGRLRRRALGGIVFADKKKRELLESILHPRIRSAWLAQVAVWRKESRPAAAVIIPLLFETGGAREFECIVCVACGPASQRQRLTARGWSDEEIEKRNASQWPVQTKMDHSHRVIWTEPSVEVHAAQLDRILRQ